MIPAVRQLLARRWVDVAVPAGLVLLALVPFVPVFGTGRLVAAALGGVALGAAVAVLGAALRWGVLPVLAALAIVLLLASALGAPTTALAGVVPTPETVGAVGQGVVTSWKDIVTVLPPLGAGGSMLTAPYLLGLVATCVAVTVALRTRRPAWALVPPAAVLVLAILLGTVDVTTSVPLGLLLALGGLVWSSWRTGRMHSGRWAGVAALVAVGAVVGTAAGTLTPPADRLVLRERVEPPPDLHDYPSPLAGFREYVKDHREEPILTVEGLPAGAQLRIATLDAYDGTAWAVGDPTRSGSGEYLRIGERIEPELGEGLHDVDLTVGAYAGAWVPVLGTPADVNFAGPRAEDLTRSFFFNRSTGTGLTTAGLRAGDTYEVLAAVPERPTNTELEGAPLADVPLPEVAYPDVVTTVAAALTADASTAIARIQAVEQGLQAGYFSHGLEGETPSLPGHGAARLDSLLGGEDPMVGDEEQYAAAMGLILRSMSVPARVVMGFEAPASTDGAVELTGDDVTAWVEVPFEGHGWVPFYPTPDEDRIWQEESPLPQNRPQPQVLQPPPPAQEPPDAPPSDRQDVEIDDDEEKDEAAFPLALLVAAAAGGLLLLLLAPLLVILAVKLRRRRRRRTRGTPSTRVAGGWSEVVDAATDLGVDVSRTATRSQAAHEMVAALAAPGDATRRRRRTAPVDASGARAADLAGRADAGTFGPAEPAEHHVASYWDEVEATLARLRTAVGRRRWWRSRVSTRSLRRARRRAARVVPQGAGSLRETVGALARGSDSGGRRPRGKD